MLLLAVCAVNEVVSSISYSLKLPGLKGNKLA